MSEVQSASTCDELARPARAREEGPVALELDDPQRQSRARECRRAEGRRPPGLVGLARHDHDGALFRGAAARGPGRGQAPCRARSFTRSSICSATRRREKLENFRGYKGAQSYPSRTKDVDDVDFSTGSVGLGRRADALRRAGAGLRARPRLGWSGREGRMVALVGDAELDEGNIFEALLEGWKHGLRKCWWIIDYNRQSLDAVIREGLWARFEALFRGLRLGRGHPEIRRAARSGLRRAGRRSAAATGSTPARTSSIRR